MKRVDVQVLRASEAGTFEGYASVFGVVDMGHDLVMPGAFAASLDKRGAGGVKMLWQHQAAEPIGVWTQIVEDGHGLKVKGRLDLSVARAREALSLLRQGAVDGLSIGFRTKRAVTDRQSGIRKLLEIDLWEISVVTFPMLTQARVDAVKRTALRPPRPRAPAPLVAVRMKLARLRAQTAALNFEFKLLRLSRSLELRYSPNQPRVPAGSREGGRWTSEGGGGAANASDGGTDSENVSADDAI
ncbi:MAG: HK97 family phage prohead protease, partial [Methylocystis sp.]|nr:HK97 family phage prohead protease [Methylocystis sp.]